MEAELDYCRVANSAKENVIEKLYNAIIVSERTNERFEPLERFERVRGYRHN
jgi:hypothetical protein